jgi:predicted neuraminidase
LRTSAGRIGRSDSNDNGFTWSPVELTDLPNNNSGIDLVKIQDETIALVYNPVAENWGKRYPMQLAISFDNGTTWPIKEVIESGEVNNEFSYPSIIYEDGHLIFCYTWNRERIKFVKVKVDGIEP